MPLINMTSDLTSLRYGKDRRNGGDSGQPYFTKDIPDRLRSINFANSMLGSDFLIRGGTRSVSSVIEDEIRLGRFFSDLRSADGLLFIAKQKLLSNQAPLTGAPPDRSYDPVNTLAQVAVNPLGIHFMKQGKEPRLNEVDKYFKLTKTKYNNNSLGENNTNKLLLLYETNIITPTVDLTAPPTTDIDLGKEIFYLTGDPTALTTGLSNLAATPEDVSKFKTNLGKFGISTSSNLLFSYQGGPNSLIGNKSSVRKVFNTNQAIDRNKTQSASTGLQFLSFTPNLFRRRNRLTTTGFGSAGISNFSQTFYEEEIETGVKKDRVKQIVGTPDNYREFNRNTTYGGGDAGRPLRDRSAYYTTNITGSTDISNIYEYDKRNTIPLYSSTTVTPISQDPIVGDIIKFNIGVLNLDTANQENPEYTWLNFRASLTSFNDNYNSTWNPIKYSGRGNNFYKYDGYTREIAMSFDAVVYSKYEQSFLYDKLNYLASVMAPNYSKAGFLRGNIIKLTLGDYLNGVLGFISNLSFSIPDETPWDIARDHSGSLDENSLQLPQIINVSSFAFTPIHNFRDEVVSRDYVTGKLDQAKQKYISMGRGQRFTQLQRKQYNKVKTETQN